MTDFAEENPFENAMGDDPEAYLARREACWPDVKPGLQKKILWANRTSKAVTPYSIIYIHGFSASAGEVRPLPDLIAEALSANVFFTRLQGHARTSPDAIGEATLDGWLEDTAEALAIGRRIGRKIIMISCSTGGTLATWALAQKALAPDVAVAVFLSPNYGIRAFGADLLQSRWGRLLARLVIGKRAGFVPENEAHAKIWTISYPIEALFTLAQTLKLVDRVRVEDIRTPAFFLYSSHDQVVRSERTRAVAARWGGPHAEVDLGDIGTGSNHVLAGDVLSPQMTAPLAAKIVDWLKAAGVHDA